MLYEGEFDVVGARGALTRFGTIAADSIAHGYLFSGPAGVGKKTFARRLAQSLLCETPKSTLLGYCNHCSACVLFKAGTHPDYFEAEGEIRIGDGEQGVLTARELIRIASLRGYRSKWRVVVLGDVEFSTPAAPNALLKFLEEPPGGVVIILTSDATGRLLPTIRSRLVEVMFAPLSADEVATVLTSEGVPREEAERAAEVSLGSVTRAREVLADEESGMRVAAVAWFEAALEGRSYDLRLDERGATAAQRREALVAMLEYVRVVARDWAASSVAGSKAPMLAADLRARVARMPKRSPAAAAEVLRAVGEAQRLAQTNVSANLVADLLRVQLAPVSL